MTCESQLPDQYVYPTWPQRWMDGLPLGNGDIGVMVWADGGTLKFTLDKTDLWDLRRPADHIDAPLNTYADRCRVMDEGGFQAVHDAMNADRGRSQSITPTKLGLGRAEIGTARMGNSPVRLDLTTATVTDDEAFTGFIHKQHNVLAIRLNAEANVDLKTIAETFPPLTELRIAVTEHSERALVQQIPEGPAAAVVWDRIDTDILLAIETANTAVEARTRAQATLDHAKDTGFEALHRDHLNRWQTFWNASSVTLPEPHIERLWRFGVYMLGSCARPGLLPPGLQGVWAMDGRLPPWRGDYHADMNVQETFWPAAPTNHLELLDCWCDYMLASREKSAEVTRKFFGTEGTFWPCASAANFTPMSLVGSWSVLQFAFSHSGWLGQLVWIRWRYSMDVDWLKRVGYPVLAGIFKFYRANLRLEDDSHLHIPLSNSPEYDESGPQSACKDPNVDIALIRKCCDWIIEFEQALDLDDLTADARQIHDTLVPYHLTDANELCLWAGKAIDRSHRHPSHLMAIHPAMDLTIDGDETTRAVIDASVEQFLALGQWGWAGHTYAQLISFAAVLGRRGFAYECLSQYARNWIGPNGLHFNRDLNNSGISMFRKRSDGDPHLPFTLEASCAVSAGISDMLVQGFNDVVRIFPAVPDAWENVSFTNLRTEGAVLVSAERRNGKTRTVRIQATADRTVRIKNPFETPPVVTSGPKIQLEDTLIIAHLPAGDVIELTAPAR